MFNWEPKQPKRVVVEDQKGPAVLDGRACKLCSTEIYTDALYCHKCGTPCQKECKKCQVILPADASFCMNCGERTLTSQEEVQKKFLDLKQQFDEIVREHNSAKALISDQSALLECADEDKARELKVEVEKIRQENQELKRRFKPYNHDLSADDIELLKAFYRLYISEGSRNERATKNGLFKCCDVMDCHYIFTKQTGLYSKAKYKGSGSEFWVCYESLRSKSYIEDDNWHSYNDDGKRYWLCLTRKAMDFIYRELNGAV